MSSYFAYVRVSAKDQNEARQIEAIREYPVDESRIYIEKQSGKDFNRPVYKRMLRKMRQKDVLVIKSIDRLGRNYNEIIEQWKVLTKEKGIDIIVIDMPLLNTAKSQDLLGTLISDLVLQLLSFVAQNERETIRQRQREGIEVAKKRGTKFGRPPKELPESFDEKFAQWKKEGLTNKEIAEKCNMHVSVLYRKKKKTHDIVD